MHYTSGRTIVTGDDFGFFQGCSMLEEIELPAAVTKLEKCCFQACTNLSKIRCLATSVPTAEFNAFRATQASTNGYLYVPEESIDLYANDSEWKIWKNIQKLD